MALKTVLKAVVGAIGSVLSLIVGVLPTDSPWKALVLALLVLGTTYGIWRAPYLPSTPVEHPIQAPSPTSQI